VVVSEVVVVVPLGAGEAEEVLEAAAPTTERSLTTEDCLYPHPPP